MNNTRKTKPQTGIHEPFKGLFTEEDLRKIRKYMQDELDRSFLYLKKKKPPVYYISYLFRNRRQESVTARLGSVTEHTVRSGNNVFCDLRVGSYRYDNVSMGGLGETVSTEESDDASSMPSEPNEDAYKYSVWKLTEAKYRESAEEFFKKKSRELHYREIYPGLASKARSQSVKDWKYRELPKLDVPLWKDILRKAGLITKKNPWIKSAHFELISTHSQSVFMSTEGSLQLQQNSFFELRGMFWTLTSQGEPISREFHFIETDPSAFPGEGAFLNKVKLNIEMLAALEKAPVINSYSGPVMLSASAASLFFHEVVGHRLEGSRQLSPDDGSTFRDLRNKKIAPEFIDISDDPQMVTCEGRGLVGHYRYDDEGNEGKKAVLVEKGVLKRFLTGSAPIPDQKELNGHGRNQNTERPISRMGNLIVRCRNPVSEEVMHDLFLSEIKNQNKPFGIWIRETLGGETETENYDFQAFKGEILHAVRVFPDGTEETIRGVDFVGTPLSALDSIICMGEDIYVDNGFCGAESGIVPVSTVCPSVLMRNLELQAGDRERYSRYTYPTHLEDKESAANRPKQKTDSAQDR